MGLRWRQRLLGVRLSVFPLLSLSVPPRLSVPLRLSVLLHLSPLLGPRLVLSLSLLLGPSLVLRLSLLLGPSLVPGQGLLAGAGPRVPAQPTPALLVAAAADLRYAFEEIGRAFSRITGTPVTFSFGSSGQLAFQVAHGAPFDALFSANEAFIQRLAERGFVVPDTVQLYAVGRLVLWTRRDAPVAVERGLPVLLDARVRYVAIANPEHAPYGEAARQALVRSGVYGPLQPKLVYGENVSLALQMVQSGNADAGIVALSLALAPPVARAGKHWLVPARLHDPIRQGAGVVARTGWPQEARAFLTFVNGPHGRPIMRRYGFVLPGEGP
ncbi:MAG: molybdate ABC transporter substrate-binding protein [Firmicutes bacterium]|nr:molybdate ABC transporter substrate-binding protein [Bacillota bacterium]